MYMYVCYVRVCMYVVNVHRGLPVGQQLRTPSQSAVVAVVVVTTDLHRTCHVRHVADALQLVAVRIREIYFTDHTTSTCDLISCAAELSSCDPSLRSSGSGTATKCNTKALFRQNQATRACNARPIQKQNQIQTKRACSAWLMAALQAASSSSDTAASMTNT